MSGGTINDTSRPKKGQKSNEKFGPKKGQRKGPGTHGTQMAKKRDRSNPKQSQDRRSQCY
jgi:hypothetical protein